MSDKIYKCTVENTSVGGIPSEIDQAAGDAWIAEYEAALKAEKKREADHKEGTFVPAYLEGMQGYILKCALENKNFKLANAPKPKQEKPTQVKEQSNG